MGDSPSDLLTLLLGIGVVALSLLQWLSSRVRILTEEREAVHKQQMEELKAYREAEKKEHETQIRLLRLQRDEARAKAIRYYKIASAYREKYGTLTS